MNSSRLLLGALLLSGAAVLAQEAGVLTPEEIGKDHVGKKVAVEGRIYSTSKSEAGIHLYFGADTTTSFQAIVSAKSIYKFQVDIVKKYDKRNVRVTGKVEEEGGRFFIRIDDSSQIKVVPRKMS